MKLDIKTTSGKKSDSNVSLNEDVFSTPYNESLIHQVITAYQAGARQGSKAQKNRSAVSGGGAKPWKQKGTGRARAGTSRSPIWRGGGQTFAASPRQYSQKVNRKSYRHAMRSILAELHRLERLVVVDEFKFDSPSTKSLASTLANFKVKNTLIVDNENNQNLYLSARNLPHVSLCTSANINPVDLIKHENVVISAKAMEEIQEKLS